jgi:hypothetical protein
MPCQLLHWLLEPGVWPYLALMPGPSITSAAAVNDLWHMIRESKTYNIVTMVLPLGSFFASRTEATRLQALEDPRNNPSWLLRWRDIVTASSSVTLREQSGKRLDFSAGWSKAFDLLPVGIIDKVLTKQEIMGEPVDSNSFYLEIRCSAGTLFPR